VTIATGAVQATNVRIYVCVVGQSRIARHKMLHLAPDGDAITLIYPFWIVIRGNQVTAVDTGFGADVAATRGVQDFRDPSVLLGQLGLSGSDVDEVVVTHLHFDHFSGAVGRFPRAQFVIQGADIDYFMRRGAVHPVAVIADPEAGRDIASLGAAGRLRVIDGDGHTEAAILFRVGGHTPGSQIVVVRDTPAPVVLAGDASHLYCNAQSLTPTALIHSYDEYQTGFTTITSLAAGGRWFPGHDPLMLQGLCEVGAGVWQLPEFFPGAVSQS